MLFAVRGEAMPYGVAFRGPRMDVMPDEILRGDRQGFDPLEDAAGAE